MLDNDQLQLILEEGESNWLGVSVEKALFFIHAKQSKRSPAFRDQYYLCISAGLRVPEAWEAIETGPGRETRRLMGYHAKADYLIEDLWGDTVLKLMEDLPEGGSIKRPSLPDGRRPARAITYEGQVKLPHYFLVVGKRLAISRHRKRKPELGLTSQDDSDGESSSRQIRDAAAAPAAESAASAESAERLGGVLKEAVTLLSAEQRALLALIYGQNMAHQDAGQLLGWSKFKVSRQHKSAMETLYDKVSGLISKALSEPERAVWEDFWGNCWIDPQSMPMSASG